MYKLKTAKSINKRFKFSSNQKMLRHNACKSHLLEKKSSKRKRKLRKVICINLNDKHNLKNTLPYKL